MRRMVLAILSVCFVSAPFKAGGETAAATPPAYLFHIDKPYGTYSVGFRTVDQADTTRSYRGHFDELGKPYAGRQARPIQTLVWYPATKSNSKPLTYGDYVRLHADEEGAFQGNVEHATAYERSILGDRALSAPMHAARNLAPVPGRFPVVIYAPSFNATADENADFCEFLASHGYLVLASPDFGSHQRMMTGDYEGVDAQSRDIGFLVGYAATLPNADPSRVAVAGYSWGGISNLFAAARDSRIDALVMLDGSTRYFPKLIKDSIDIKPAEIDLPILFFTQKDISMEEIAEHHMSASDSVLNELTHSDLTIVHMHAMEHGEFGGSNHRNVDFWTHMPPSEYSREEINQSFSWVAEYTLQFLNAKLKSDAAASAFLSRSPLENGAPPHLFSIDRHTAQGQLATIDTFRGELGRRGFDHASEVYAEFKKRSGDFKIDEGQLNTWGYLLANENHFPEAIDIMKLNTELYPKSTNAWDALGEAYRNAGDMPNAVASYKKAVEVDPANDTVKAKLKQYAK